MNTITSRFFDVLKELGISITSLAAEIPNITTKQKLSNAKNGRNEVQIDVVSYICSTYPIVSCDYILTGNGPMFKEEQTPQNINEHSQVIQIDNTKQIKYMLDVMNEQQKTIENLTEYIKKIESKPKNSIENKKDGMTA